MGKRERECKQVRERESTRACARAREEHDNDRETGTLVCVLESGWVDVHLCGVCVCVCVCV